MLLASLSGIVAWHSRDCGQMILNGPDFFRSNLPRSAIGVRSSLVR